MTTARKLREFQRRERDILDAALPLLATDDWLSVTVDQIAAASEIAKGTIYKHFVSKEEIYAHLALDFQRALLQDLRQIDPRLDVPGKVEAILRVYWQAYWERHQYRQIVEFATRESFRKSLSPSLRADFDHVNEQQMTIFIGVLEEGMRQGMFPRRQAEVAFMGPQALVSGMILMIWSGCFPDAAAGDAFISELAGFLFAGLSGSGRSCARTSSG